MLVPLLAVLPLALAGVPTSTLTPTAVAAPAHVRPGDAFLILVRGTTLPPAAEVADRALTFFRMSDGFAAVAALPIEAPAGVLTVPIDLSLTPNHRGDAGRIELSVEVAPPAFPHRDLEVERRFVETPPPAVLRRIEEDRAAVARAFSQPAAPPLFTVSFDWPRRDRVTARYGEKRTLNGVKPSQHYGLDMAGKLGDPVDASNAGEVVLVRDCWFSGNTVILWHGAGLYSAYFHLSQVLVQKGDRVARGQRIGLVGKTGRASGPHLHWGTKVNGLYVDPESVLRLDLDLERGPHGEGQAPALLR